MGQRSRNKNKNKLKEDKIGKDKISNLPDSTLYRILSLLQLDDIARVNSLSKRFRKPCSFLASLEIDVNICEDKEIQSSYLYFLNKVMALWNRDITSLHIPWFDHKANEGLHVNEWIHKAARCNVQDLKIGVTPENGEDIVLLPCESLRSLELDLHNNGILKLPSMGFTLLGDLTLKSVEIACAAFAELVSSCKSLTKLTLENFSGMNSIEITSSSLQEIKLLKTNSDDLDHLKVSAEALRTIYVTWYFRSSTNKLLHLSAPKLQSLRWRGDTINDCNLEKFKSLQDASFNLRHPSMLTQCLSTMDEASIHDSLFELISSVRGVKSLELNCWQIEVLVTHDRQPTSLGNLEKLILNVSDFKECQVSAIVLFLKLLPNLQTLDIKCCRQPWGANLGNSMGLEASSYDTGEWISHLNFVEIELTGGGDEIQLLEYLLKHAKELKKMTILYSILDVHRLSEIAKALHEFKRASSHVSMFFLPYY